MKSSNHFLTYLKFFLQLTTSWKKNIIMKWLDLFPLHG